MSCFRRQYANGAGLPIASPTRCKPNGMIMRELTRAYVCVLLAGTIFIACQALSGGLSSDPPESPSVEPGDRSYRVETMGRASRTLSETADRTALVLRRPGKSALTAN